MAPPSEKVQADVRLGTGMATNADSRKVFMTACQLDVVAVHGRKTDHKPETTRLTPGTKGSRQKTMKNRLLSPLTTVIAVGVTGFLLAGDTLAQRDAVIMNRGSGTLSIIDGQSDNVIATVEMPDGGEPMYAAYSPQFHRFFVVDRANSQVVVFDANDFNVVGTVPTGAGAFHCWIDPFERKLAVTNDLDQSVTIIDTVDLDVITTIELPDELVKAGYRAHDVNIALGWWDHGLFVTMLAPDAPGYVLRYSSFSYKMTAARELGGDPHVTMSIFQPAVLYVMAQDSDSYHAVSRWTLDDIKKPLHIAGAHGAVMNRFYLSRFLYTTDIENSRIVTIRRKNFRIVDSLETPNPTAHNLAVSTLGDKLYVTHSGAASNVVTIYDLNRWTGRPSLRAKVEVGLNPFGLATVPSF